jgi:hypothetical protein
LAAIGAFRNLDDTMRRATTLFFVLKIAMAVISLEATTAVFAGAADAITYSNEGASIAFDWSIGIPIGHQDFPGTGGVNLIVGHLYSLTVPNEWLGFLMFAWASAIGTILIWFGVARYWPPDSRRKFGLAVMFLPSLLYWTSPISKEAVVMLGFGFFFVGLRQIFDGVHLFWGSIFLVGGGLITYVVRPDITLLLVVSAAAALLIPWSRRIAARPSPSVRALVVVALLVLLVPVIAANRQLLHLNSSQSFIQGAVSTAQQKTTIGGNSAYEATTPTSIVDVPYAVVSVLFRPFPWEARSLLQVLASAEGIFLGVWLIRMLIGWRKRRLRPRMDGMMIMSIVFVLTFCVVFSSLGNFGLLVRERVQELPFLLVILNSFESRSEIESNDLDYEKSLSRRTLG